MTGFIARALFVGAVLGGIYAATGWHPNGFLALLIGAFVVVGPAFWSGDEDDEEESPASSSA